MNEQAETIGRLSSRAKFTLLVLVAALPIVVAYIAFFHFPHWIPTGTTNKGSLISPPVSGEALSVELAGLNAWTLLQPIGERCGQGCERMLYLSRQVVVGLGKDATRVRRIVLVEGEAPSTLESQLGAEHPDVSLIQGDLGLLDQVTVKRPVLFLMDPHGNVMMYYHIENAGKPMLNDLKHLLRISNIG
jgi:hypothetical protein